MKIPRTRSQSYDSLLTLISDFCQVLGDYSFTADERRKHQYYAHIVALPPRITSQAPTSGSEFVASIGPTGGFNILEIRVFLYVKDDEMALTKLWSPYENPFSHLNSIC